MYDTEWFKNRIKEKRPKDYKEYRLLTKYKNSHSKVRFKHLICGNYFEITPNSFLRGRGCNSCNRAKAARAQSKPLDEIYKNIPCKIKIVGKFLSVSKPVKVHCSECGNTYSIRIYDLERRKRCPFCSGYNKETTATFKKEVYDLVGDSYTVIGKYTKANILISMRHNSCGTVYKVTPHNFKRGRRCPHCCSSCGEKIIEQILIENNVKFESQKKFINLKDKNPLSYDFYIPCINALIEYQGEQHYKPIKFFGGKSNYNIQVKHDLIKKNYALKNGYLLIEIPYTVSTKKDIFNFLKSFIKILGN